MNLTTREFMQLLGAGTMASMGLGTYAEAEASAASSGLYDIGKFGSVSFLHMTDCHAQLKPIYFREPKCLGSDVSASSKVLVFCAFFGPTKSLMRWPGAG